MCGILAVLSTKIINTESFTELERLLQNRGPDSSFSNYSTFPIDSVQNLNLFTSGHILSLRKPLINQPIVGDRVIFLYNGEIYDGLNLIKNESDTEKLYHEIDKNFDGSFDSLSKILSPLNGEYAFIFYHRLSNSLWFGRDPIGRRSLVANFSILHPINTEVIVISSVACRDNGEVWNEIPAGYLYSIGFSHNLKETEKDVSISSFNLNKYLFTSKNKIFAYINACLPDEDTLVSEFLKLLEKSVELRIMSNTIENNTIDPKTSDSCTRIGVLFSGGIDCTTVCAIASKYIPISSTIELLNVAFYKEGYTADNSPDRISARKSHIDLCQKFPNVNWILIEINVSASDIEFYRKEKIKHLIYPLNTVLDDSLGCGLWFASRGKGTSYNIIDGARVMLLESYRSDSKILLSGLGADELLGGYSRYYNIYKNGIEAVEKEMKMDIDRLHSRNLGRDDRCCSDNGREVRYPYLDEYFINFCQMIPSKYKCDFTLPKGLGDKKILRKAAHFLGLCDDVCFNKKTALQFGSQFVKVSGKENSASEISQKLL